MGLNKIADLAELGDILEANGGSVRLIIDNPVQISGLEEFESRKKTGRKWSIFVKVDAGNGYAEIATFLRFALKGHLYRRAGQVPNTPAMTALLEASLSSLSVSIYGFYCHAGNSYASKSIDEGTTFLTQEVTAVNIVAAEAKQVAARLSKALPSESWVLSVGSTPTTHAASSATVREKIKKMLHGTLELHAGEAAYPQSVRRS